MAWITIAKSVVTGFTGCAYENTATAANTYSEANGSYSGGIRTFTTPGPSPNETTYVRCRMVADSIERGELSKNYFDARRP